MKGRDKCFQCIYCGKFVSYDMRRTGRNHITTQYWDQIDGIYYPEEEVEFYHKKCKKDKK